MAATPLIAIVDDDTSLLAALVRLIRSYGFGVRGFGSAEEFIASQAASGCACVVTDIQMPGMGGMELADFLAEQQPGLPVIAVTAHAEKTLEHNAQASGVTCFLRKPIDPDKLIECLDGALRR